MVRVVVLFDSPLGHRRVSFGCTSDTRIYFIVKLPDGVILDKTIVDQLRSHHAIFMETIVLASIARINDALLTKTQMMLFRSENKFCHMMQESQIVAGPQYLIHPLCPVHEEILHTARNKSQIDWDLVFSLLHLELDLDPKQVEREEMRG